MFTKACHFVCVCGGGHNTLFTTACQGVCGGGHTTMFKTAFHYVCVCGEGHITTFTTARHCVCVVEGRLPCSQKPVTVCVCV